MLIEHNCQQKNLNYTQKIKTLSVINKVRVNMDSDSFEIKGLGMEGLKQEFISGKKKVLISLAAKSKQNIQEVFYVNRT